MFEKSQLATVMELFSKQNALSFNKMLGWFFYLNYLALFCWTD